MKKLCVVGNPVEHSLSPKIHSGFAQDAGVDIEYHQKCLPADDFAGGIQQLRDEGYSGFSVTVPFKEKAFELADELSEYAKSAEAVNTLYLKGDKLIGDNTDGRGLVQDFMNKGVDLNGKSVLVLGAGGAAKGIIGPLKSAGADISVMNRTVEKARALADQFQVGTAVIPAEARIQDSFSPHIIINATSASLNSTSGPWESLTLSPDTICYDLMYSKTGDTPFTQYAKSQNALQVFDGYGMLFEQARLQFELFTSN